MGKFSSIEPVPAATEVGDHFCRGKGRYKRGCQVAPVNWHERQWDGPRSRGGPPGSLAASGPTSEPWTLRRAAQSGTREFPGSPKGSDKLCCRQCTAKRFQGGVSGGLVVESACQCRGRSLDSWSRKIPNTTGQLSTMRHQLTDQMCCSY